MIDPTDRDHGSDARYVFCDWIETDGRHCNNPGDHFHHRRHEYYCDRHWHEAMMLDECIEPTPQFLPPP